MNVPLHRWRNNARIAVTVSVLLEIWAKGKSPSYFPRTTALERGAPDIAAHQWSDFGVKEGIHRLLAILSRHKLHATVFVSAIAAEQHSKLIKQIVDAGHTVAAHGYSQDQFLTEMNKHDQQQMIRQCLDLLEQATGERPRGWCSPVYSWTEDTRDLLVQEGILWHADALDSTLPYWQTTTHGKIVALPWCDFVDNRVLGGNPRVYFEVYRDTFDYIYRNEQLGLLHIGIHSHFGGRPLMSARFDHILKYMSASSAVWFTTHDAIVTWFKEQNVDRISSEYRFEDSVTA